MSTDSHHTLSTEETIRLEDTYQIPSYSKYPIALVRGQGPYVWDAEGRRYLDFYGGHCVLPLGHCPPAVVGAVRAQAGELMFYSNVVYSPVRAEAAARLAALAPEGLRHVFFCNSGTESNETALKLARTYTGRSHVIAMEGSFHGRTLGSLAVTWEEKYRKPFQSVLPDTTFVPFGRAGAVEAVLSSRTDVAALILEPIQSMAGVESAPPSYFEQLRQLCDAHGVVLIFDEVQTGVGRTGAFSISEKLGVQPDLITLAKSLGSGIPVGAVLVSDAIAATVRSGDQGTTFGGGMIAMAAVAATLQRIEEDRLAERASAVFERIRDGVGPLVQEVRGAGCLMGLVCDAPVRELIKGLLADGVLTGSSSDPRVLRIMPPLNTPDEAIDEFIETFTRVFHATFATENSPT